ncbi:hypothetical protein IWQ61_008141 [Dispira simplex]|nr:hypothetical protein IWQ61_008141 [Dispira simplex]
MATSSPERTTLLATLPPKLVQQFRVFAVPTSESSPPDHVPELYRRVVKHTTLLSTSRSAPLNSMLQDALKAYESGPTPMEILPTQSVMLRPVRASSTPLSHDRVTVRITYVQGLLDITFIYDLRDLNFPPDLIVTPVYEPTKITLTGKQPLFALDTLVARMERYTDTDALWAVRCVHTLYSLYKEFHHRQLGRFYVDRIRYEYGCWKDNPRFEGRMVYTSDGTPSQVILRLPLTLPERNTSNSTEVGTLWVTYGVPSSPVPTNEVTNVSVNYTWHPAWRTLGDSSTLPVLVKTRSLVNYADSIMSILVRQQTTQVAPAPQPRPVLNRTDFVKHLAHVCKRQLIEYDPVQCNALTILVEIPKLPDSGNPVATAVVTCIVPRDFPVQPLEIRLSSPLYFDSWNSSTLKCSSLLPWKPSSNSVSNTSLSRVTLEWRSFVKKEVLRFHNAVF